MSGASKIEWTQRTWNPIVGCSIHTPGCTNCYAMEVAGCLEAMAAAGRPGLKHYRGTTKREKSGFVWSGKVNAAPEHIRLAPLGWKKPALIFVNSMSDLFHPEVPDELVDEIFAVMALCPQHCFQLLTKRMDRAHEYLTSIQNGSTRLAGAMWRSALVEGAAQKIWYERTKDETVSEWLAVHLPLPNVWLGTSVEDQKRADERIPVLLDTPAAVRWLSCEPLLGPVELESIDLPNDGALDALTGDFLEMNGNQPYQMHGEKIDWVVVGGESGPRARPMHPSWARSLRDQCAAAGVPFFFKQWGDWHPSDQHDCDMKGGIMAFRSDDSQDWTWEAAYWATRPGWQGMCRIGKKRAGRELDGRTHDQFPEAANG